MIDDEDFFRASEKSCPLDFLLIERSLESGFFFYGGAGRQHEIEGKIFELSRRPAPRCGVRVELHPPAEENEGDVWLFR